MSDPQQEKRAYTRVRTRLKARARRIAPEEKPLFRQTASQSALAEEAVNAGLSEAVAAFLQEMDRKMDTILGILGAEELERDFPITLEAVELSGAGIRFSPSPDIAPGDLLEVVITLSSHPYRLAGTVGEVADPAPDTGELRFVFTGMRETDLEEIIRFVFQEQREQIRTSKKLG